jgi:AraC family transcriptional regulator, positive regulator of tynA and feaB
MGARFDPKGDLKTFAGWVRPTSVSGLMAAEVGSNAHRVERTDRDVRLDGADHFVALFQLVGRSAMTHNEEVVRFDVAISGSWMWPGPRPFLPAMRGSRGIP